MASPLPAAPPYPSYRDMERRPQVVDRKDAIYCLDMAAYRRAEAMRRRPVGDGRDALIGQVRATLANARRYQAQAVARGWRLP